MLLSQIIEKWLTSISLFFLFTCTGSVASALWKKDVMILMLMLMMLVMLTVMTLTMLMMTVVMVPVAV